MAAAPPPTAGPTTALLALLSVEADGGVVSDERLGQLADAIAARRGERIRLLRALRAHEDAGAVLAAVALLDDEAARREADAARAVDADEVAMVWLQRLAAGATIAGAGLVLTGQIAGPVTVAVIGAPVIGGGLVTALRRRLRTRAARNRFRAERLRRLGELAWKGRDAP